MDMRLSTGQCGGSRARLSSSTGTCRDLSVPAGPGVRVDSGVTEGSEISEHFDSMIAKIIVWAPTRELCIARARRACLELDAAVEDGATNQAFLLIFYDTTSLYKQQPLPTG